MKKHLNNINLRVIFKLLYKMTVLLVIMLSFSCCEPREIAVIDKSITFYIGNTSTHQLRIDAIYNFEEDYPIVLRINIAPNDSIPIATDNVPFAWGNNNTDFQKFKDTVPESVELHFDNSKLLILYPNSENSIYDKENYHKGESNSIYQEAYTYYITEGHYNKAN